jgi:hypothetical protein
MITIPSNTQANGECADQLGTVVVIAAAAAGDSGGDCEEKGQWLFRLGLIAMTMLTIAVVLVVGEESSGVSSGGSSGCVDSGEEECRRPLDLRRHRAELCHLSVSAGEKGGKKEGGEHIIDSTKL